MKNVKTILADDQHGIFIGTKGNIAIFSKGDPFESTKVFGFKNRDAAQDFVETYMDSRAEHISYYDVTTNSNSDYVDVVDIIKSGHEEIAGDLFENLFDNDLKMQ